MLSEINKKKKYKYLLYVIIYFWTPENKTVKSLVIQWLGLHIRTAEGLGLLPAWGTRILQAMWQGLNK